MSAPTAIVATRPSDVPTFALHCLEANPINANLMLPTLYKCRQEEEQGIVLQGQLWVVVHIQQQVLLIVSCTTGYMGEYPIFFFTPFPYASLDADAMTPALRLVAYKLRENLHSRRRVYSIFAPEIISVTFADIWSQIAGVRREREPYYHAKISYLTPTTFIEKRTPPLQGAYCDLRRGNPADLQGIADLCYRFAHDSPPFQLPQQEALREAQILVNEGKVWVYSVAYPGQRPIIASIVATTRNTPTTATITKVFTHPQFRGQGCAEVLVRHVCKELLRAGKQYIVLYVGLTNKAANVYKKVGFVGVGDGASPYPGVDPWLELGFDHTYVNMGQW
ncbi:hypothetical protein CVT26_005831 [Gymnopilus dilepis]|uniref:N-acetyltransferase domain-containing protein n=1 Tax=Gymnopilus dilepis TaxID=231916 RepID=A0A409VNU8_9AGAR|nr:hypothetical protein CVT26_005831 [Gymnopilus dilepis]